MTLDWSFFTHSVKGHFCELLVSNIFCLPLFLRIVQPSFFYTQPLYTFYTFLFLSCKQDLLLFTVDFNSYLIMKAVSVAREFSNLI